MSKNQIYDKAEQLEVTVPSGRIAGDPVMVGQIPGVCLTDRDATTGQATVKFNGAADLSVKGENNAGAVAVAEGDILYYETGQVPPVNKDNVAGIRFGYALAPVTSGATATIRVKIGY